MYVLVAIIFWLLLGMLALVGLALITPLVLRVHLTTSPKFAYRIEVRALAGLAPRLRLAADTGKQSDAKPKANQKHHEPSRHKRVQGAVVRAVPSLVKGILQRIHLTELHIDAEYGLSDPADTGQLCGLLMPLQFAPPLPASVSLDLRPDFTKRCLNGSLTAVVRFTVAAMLVPVAQFAWRAFGPFR
jgi:hypothetical protein